MSFNRYNFEKKKFICSNCLQSSHHSGNCSRDASYTTCASRHHDLLHFDKGSFKHEIPREVRNFIPQFISYTLLYTSTNVMSTVLSSKLVSKAMNISPSVTVILATAMVDVLDSKGKRKRCRIMLDSGSQASFISLGVVRFWDYLNLSYL